MCWARIISADHVIVVAEEQGRREVSSCLQTSGNALAIIPTYIFYYSRHCIHLAV